LMAFKEGSRFARAAITNLAPVVSNSCLSIILIEIMLDGKFDLCGTGRTDEQFNQIGPADRRLEC
jgi:hypothetical protein